MTLNVDSLFCRQCYVYCDVRLYLQPDVSVTEACNTNVWQQTNVWQIEVRTAERYIADADADADLQNILEPPTRLTVDICARILFLYYIF